MRLMPAMLMALSLGLGSRARANEIEYKSWKTFESDIGYEFKYPSCWKVNWGLADEDGPLQAQRALDVIETPECAQPAYSSHVPNSMSFWGGAGPKNNASDAVKEINFTKKVAPNNIETRRWLVFKKIDLGHDTALGWVEVLTGISGTIRWQFKIYCPDWWILVTGPAVEKKNIRQEWYAKFKKGDLAVPEPYNTIIHSVRCIPAKQQEGKY